MAMTLITNSADTDSTDLASIVFNSSIDSTYKLYIFKFIDINPATDNVSFSFQVNATDDDGGDYDVSLITSTWFVSGHSEADSTVLSYDANYDQAQAAGFQVLHKELGNGGDESSSGTLWLFNPSSTTYVKHFYSTVNGYLYHNWLQTAFAGGYINDTTAIDDIQFKMSSGNFDGTIKMYGVG